MKTIVQNIPMPLSERVCVYVCVYSSCSCILLLFSVNIPVAIWDVVKTYHVTPCMSCHEASSHLFCIQVATLEAGQRPGICKLLTEKARGSSAHT